MNNPSYLGLDIGRSSIKAAQVSLGEKGPALEGLLRLERTSRGGALSAGEAGRLVRALDRQGMRACRLVLVAPTDALVSGSLNLPPASKDVPRDRIVEGEVSRVNRLSPGTFEFAWWDLPPKQGGGHAGQAHAVALPHAAVRPTLDTLCALGLDAVRTLSGSLAMLSAARRLPVDPRRISAVLDLGSKRAHLVLMYAGRVVHERELPDFDMSSLRAEAVAALGVDERVAGRALARYGLHDEPTGTVACQMSAILAEAVHTLVDEVSISFAYVSHIYPEAELGPLLLVGGGANLPGVCEAIGEELELETQVMRPASLVKCDYFACVQADASMTVALGAAIAGGEA